MLFVLHSWILFWNRVLAYYIVKTNSSHRSLSVIVVCLAQQDSLLPSSTGILHCKDTAHFQLLLFVLHSRILFCHRVLAYYIVKTHISHRSLSVIVVCLAQQDSLLPSSTGILHCKDTAHFQLLLFVLHSRILFCHRVLAYYIVKTNSSHRSLSVIVVCLAQQDSLLPSSTGILQDKAKQQSPLTFSYCCLSCTAGFSSAIEYWHTAGQSQTAVTAHFQLLLFVLHSRILFCHRVLTYYIVKTPLTFSYCCLSCTAGFSSAIEYCHTTF